MSKVLYVISRLTREWTPVLWECDFDFPVDVLDVQQTWEYTVGIPSKIVEEKNGDL